MVAALAPDPGKAPHEDVAMDRDCDSYEVGGLAIVGVLAFLGVSILSGWVQIVAGSVLGMLVVAVTVGRILRSRSTRLTSSAANTVPRKT
jgi:hypothetical protein